jgi:ATP-dependent Clp protease ATP-binding subunit ClpC
MDGYNLTERVRKVLLMAREEAQRLHHEYVGTEHMLLALTREEGGVAAAALRSIEVDGAAIRHRIEEVVKVGNAAHQTGSDLPYTSRAKKVLELAMSAARELDHSYVGTEHLLLALAREGRGIACQILAERGATAETLLREITTLLGPPGPPDIGRSSSPAAGSAAGEGRPRPPGAAVEPGRSAHTPSGTITVLIDHPDGRIEARRFASAFDAVVFLCNVDPSSMSIDVSGPS